MFGLRKYVVDFLFWGDVSAQLLVMVGLLMVLLGRDRLRERRVRIGWALFTCGSLAGVCLKTIIYLRRP